MKKFLSILLVLALAICCAFAVACGDGGNVNNNGTGGNQSGITGDNTGDNGGNQGGNVGDNTGDNGGNQGGNTGDNTGDNGGNQGGNVGDNTGDNGGNQGGNTGDNTGDNGGNQGGNVGDNTGDNGGNTGDQPGTGDEPEQPGTGDQPGDEPGDEPGNEPGDEPGDGEQGQVVYTVTESEFTSALNITNAPFQFVLTQASIFNGQTSVRSYALNYSINMLEYISYNQDSTSDTTYFAIENGVCYVYFMNENEWYKSETDKELYDSQIQAASPHTFLYEVAGLNCEFADFTFDTDTNSYVFNTVIEGMTATVSLKFENAKIVELVIVGSEEGFTSVITQTFAYENLDINLPQVSEPGDEPGNEPGDEECQHIWQKVSLEDGIMTYECTECGNEKTEDKTDLYIRVSANIADSINELADSSNSNSKFSAKFSADNLQWIDASWADHGMNVKGVTMFVKMLSAMMRNDGFCITSDPVAFTYSYEKIGEEGAALLMYEFDEENNKVVMYWSVSSYMKGSERNIFIYMDVDYDFSTDTLLGFGIESIQSMDSDYFMFAYKYSQDEFKFTADPGLVDQIYEKASKLEEKEDSIIFLEADFTKEYSEMMDEMNAGSNIPEGEDPNVGSTIPSEICGTYALTSLSVVMPEHDPVYVNVGEPFGENGVLTSDYHVITITEDGSYFISGPNYSETIKGKCFYVDGNLIFDIEEASQKLGTSLIYISLSNDVLDMTVTIDGVATVTYTHAKQSGDIPVKPEPENTLVGSYLLTYMVFQGQTYCLGDEAPWGDDIISPTTVTMYIYDSGSLDFISKVGGREATTSGTWSYVDGVLSMTLSGMAIECEISQEGGITATAMGVTYSFIKGEISEEIPDQPQEKTSFIFYIKQFSYASYEWTVGGESPNGGVMTREFAVLKLNPDYTACLTTDGEDAFGYWEIIGDEIMITLEDEDAFLFAYNMDDNTISFRFSGYTYVFDMPEGIGYSDIIGEIVDCQVYNLGTMAIGENTFGVGDQLFNGNIVEQNTAELKVYQNGKFKFVNPLTTVRGYYNVDNESGIVYANYVLGGDEYVIEITLVNHGASLTFEMDGILYNLNADKGETGDSDDNYGALTEEEFNNAINLRGRTIATQTITYTTMDNQTFIDSAYVTFKDECILALQNAEGYETWVYYINVDGVYYMFNSDDFVVWEEVPDYPAEMGYMQAVMLYTPYGMVDMLGLTFYNFSYDEVENVYYYDDGETGVYLRIESGVVTFVSTIIRQEMDGNVLIQKCESHIDYEAEDVYFPSYEEITSVKGDVTVNNNFA